tara:strand:+ start:11659 stop:13212 length:1554 start_codon:yes stop_codon:yes gene_type:complete
MATTSNSYTGNNSTVDYAFTFPYLKSTDIKVSLDNVVKTISNDYTLHNATTIRFNSAPANNAAIKIYRDTGSDSLAATFYPGSAIRSSDLNDNYTQNLYVTQEAENDANTALDNSRVLESGAYVSAITKATTAVTTANTASTNATTAVNTANTASSTASSAVSTANTASTTASNAVTTANSATTTANSATTTANSAVTTANAATTTANTASTNATNAVSTANTASTNATNAVNTANTASTNATNAVNTANTASTNASNAVTTANAAQAAVADAVTYTQKANEAALQGFTPGEDASDNKGYYEVTDSTNLINEGWVYSGVHYKTIGIPSTFEGAPGLTVRLEFDFNSASGADASNQRTFTWMSYFANDPEERYLPNQRVHIAGTPTAGNINYYTVKVATKNAFHRYNGTGSSNGFTINGEQAPFLEWTPGITYRFDQADSSNANHTLKFYEEADKTTLYSTGVTLNGTPGQAGAYTQIVTTDTLPTVLHYMCAEQAHEGNGIQTNTAFTTIYDGGAFT